MEATPQQEALINWNHSRSHADFARMVEVDYMGARVLVEAAVSRLPMADCTLTEIMTAPNGCTYALVRILTGRDAGQYATYLVAHKSQSQARFPSNGVYLDNGHYGHDFQSGSADLIKRAS